MATTIVTKNGTGAPTASDLVAGELAVDLTNGRLYTTDLDSGGTVIEIGLNPSGNVDVTGTVTADGLTVDGSSTFDDILLTAVALPSAGNPSIALRNTDNNIYIQAGSGNAITFLDSSQNTMLSTTPTSHSLQISNGNAFAIDSNRDISFYEDTGTTAKFFWDASAESLGIGTGSPSNTKLHVYSASSSNTLPTNAQAIFETSANGGIALSAPTGNSIGVFFPYSTDAYAYGVERSTNNLTFRSGGSERMRIDSSGAVIVNNSGGDAQIYLGGSGGTSRMYLARSGTDALLWNVDGGVMKFGTNNTERMRIDSSGNVGINVVPSTDWSGNSILQIGTKASFSSSSSFSGFATNLVATSSGWAVKYTSAGAASAYLQATSDGSHRFYTAPVGTAGATATLSEAMRIDASGNVGIGTEIPATTLHLENDASTSEIIRIGSSTVTHDTGLYMRTTGTAGISWGTGGALAFYGSGAGAAERMRIDSSGNLHVGFSTYTSMGTVNTGARWSSDGTTNALARGSDGTILSFYSGNGGAGNISVTANSAAYNTSSDQRLKENIVDAPSASDDIDAIQVRSFDWKVDGSHQKYGMVAQELQSVAPEAVSGDADSEEMMGVDYSKLVPMMLKEIQSLRARVAQLES